MFSLVTLAYICCTQSELHVVISREKLAGSGEGGGTTEEAAQGAAAASASTPNQVPYVKHTPQEPYQLPSGRQMDRI